MSQRESFSEGSTSLDVISSVYSSQNGRDIEIEEQGDRINRNELESDSEDETAYADEPLADEEWLKHYNEQLKATEELESQLTERLKGKTPVTEWCKCGNCSTILLQNISECYCCCELDGCGEALCSDQVVEEIDDLNIELKCITDHPGFRPVCLETWSLRMAADHYKTKNKTRYRQTGSEEAYLRSVAYREFSRLVYGFLGNKRIPLPACAYTAIRQKFQTDEEFTGFELDESVHV